MEKVVSILRKPIALAGTVLVLVLGGLFIHGKPWAQENRNLPSLVNRSPKVQGELRVIEGLNHTDKISEAHEGVSSTVVVTGQAVTIYDRSGMVKKKLVLEAPERTRVSLSKRGNLIAQMIAHNVSEKGPEKISLELSDSGGNPLWQSDNFGIGPYYVSEANDSVVQRMCDESSCSDKLVIYSRSIPQGRTIDSGIGSGWVSTGGDISQDGTFFAITYKNESGDYSLGYYDLGGTLVWKYRALNSNGNQLALSPTGKYLVAVISDEESHNNKILLFDKDGKIIKEQISSYVGDYCFAFSENEVYVAVGSTSGELYEFQANPVNTIWEYRADKGVGFLSIDVANDGSILGSATTINASDYSDGSLPRYVIVFDNQGTVRSTIEYKDHGYAAWSEGPKAVNDRLVNSSFSVVLRDKIVRYEK